MYECSQLSGSWIHEFLHFPMGNLKKTSRHNVITFMLLICGRAASDGPPKKSPYKPREDLKKNAAIFKCHAPQVLKCQSLCVFCLGLLVGLAGKSQSWIFFVGSMGEVTHLYQVISQARHVQPNKCFQKTTEIIYLVGPNQKNQQKGLVYTIHTYIYICKYVYIHLSNIIKQKKHVWGKLPQLWWVTYRIPWYILVYLPTMKTHQKIHHSWIGTYTVMGIIQDLGNGNLSGLPPQCHPPSRNKALVRPSYGKPMVHSPLIRPLFLGGTVALGGRFPLGSHDWTLVFLTPGHRLCRSEGDETQLLQLAEHLCHSTWI